MSQMDPKSPLKARRCTPNRIDIRHASETATRREKRVIDGRTRIGKCLMGWRDELIGDLGGQTAISTQQRALVDLVVRTKLMLDSVDTWLLTQPSLVNARKRSLLPVVRERTQLADAIARYLAALGLERRAKPVTPLHEYLANRSQGLAKTQPDSDNGSAT